VVLENQSTATSEQCFKLLTTKPITTFSNNIRSNFGHTNRCSPETMLADDKMFVQQGRKVFKEVLPMVCQLIEEQLEEANLAASDLKRLFLHQANINMILLSLKRF